MLLDEINRASRGIHTNLFFDYYSVIETMGLVLKFKKRWTLIVTSVSPTHAALLLWISTNLSGLILELQIGSSFELCG